MTFNRVGVRSGDWHIETQSDVFTRLTKHWQSQWHTPKMPPGYHILLTLNLEKRWVGTDEVG